MTSEFLCEVFSDGDGVQLVDIQEAIKVLLKAGDPVQELKLIAGGYHYHIKPKYASWVKKSQDPEKKTELYQTVGYDLEQAKQPGLKESATTSAQAPSNQQDQSNDVSNEKGAKQTTPRPGSRQSED